ncbi:DASH family cryptochrome [Alkalicoccus saliphilus]|jgi:deoxyribodipyrimidine photo-lyase|uniref:Cryptochrome DASH n=1 Tax=Alkalicoccus saliphilus TaxID=200989 RepID=A0A2T4U7L5_9BACI|nr:DASH family cryptochrome [Alkalicoccus saliphilus]PTL39386.1 hypothetical protein C6Y45_06035 [Alkalicoccus saliphilus]
MEFVWIRHDTRVHDHLPLVEALASEQPVMAGFVFDRRNEEKTEAGFQRMDAKRLRFLIENLLELHQQLGLLGVPLVVSSGDPVQELRQWMKEYPVTNIRAYRLPGIEEAEDEAGLEEAAREAEAGTSWYYGDTLIHPEDLPFSLEDLPGSFHEFEEKLLEEKVEPRHEVEMPREQTPLYLEEHAATGEELMRLFRDSQAETLVNGGEKEALRRLDDYFFKSRHVLHYRQRRNEMLEFDAASKLSPWIAGGALSPRYVAVRLEEVRKEEDAESSVQRLYTSLLKRDYFHFLLYKEKEKCFAEGGLRKIPIEWKKDREVFEAWCSGNTGYPLVDAGMRQLKACGHTADCARRIAAAFLTNVLGVDWRWGAAWFEAHLIDHDVSVNYGSWMELAGIGTGDRGFQEVGAVEDGRTYDPDGTFVKKWVPELEFVPLEHLFSPYLMSEKDRKEAALDLGHDYPYPIVSLEAATQERREIYSRSVRSSS